MSYVEKCDWCGREFENDESNYYYAGPVLIRRSDLFFCSARCRHAYNDAKKQKQLERERAEHEANLKREREAERKRDPKNWYGSEWAEHLSRHPEDAFQCDWGKLRGADCALLFSARPELAAQVEDWPNRLNGDDWEKLLACQSCFWGKCNLNKLGANNWTGLIRRYPQVADKCHKWDEMDVDHWVELLKDQPQFVEKCNWSKIKQNNQKDASEGLRVVLEVHPELVDKCDLDILSANSWANLLQVHPSLSTKCDKWSSIDIEHWVELLKKQPQFMAEFEGRVDFSKLKDEDWNVLLSDFPRFANRYGLWSADPVSDVVKMVGKFPALAVAYDWERLGEKYKSIEESNGVGVLQSSYKYPLLNELAQNGISRQAFESFVAGIGLHAWMMLQKWDCRYALDDIVLTEKKLRDVSEEEVFEFLCMVNVNPAKYISKIGGVSRLSVEKWIEVVKKKCWGSNLRSERENLFLLIDTLLSKAIVFTVENWAGIVEECPAVYDKYCRSIKFTSDQWARIVRSHPEMYEKYCTEIDFGPTQWGCALSTNCVDEKLTKFFNPRKFSSEDWVDFLIAFDGWDRKQFNSKVKWGGLSAVPAGKWIKLVLKDKEYVSMLNWKKFKASPDAWKGLSTKDWLTLISRWKGAVEYLNPDTFNWSALTAEDWVRLLWDFPQFKERCDVSKVDWTSLERMDMLRALCFCPEGIVAYYHDWASISHRHWKELVEHQPILKSYMAKYDKGKKDAKGDEDDKEENDGCQLGCLGTLLKLIFWCVVIWYGLSVGVSFVDYSKFEVPEKARGLLNQMSNDGMKVREWVLGLIVKAQEAKEDKSEN